jgi:hypothetical protein
MASADSKDEWLERVFGIAPPASSATPEPNGDALGADKLHASWQKAYDGCLTQAHGLKAAMVKQISAVDEGMLPDFENGWATFEQELAGVGDLLQSALAKAGKAPAADRQKVVAQAVAAATKMIESSSLLSDIDQNDVQPVNIVATLRQELDELQREAGG